jgi:hypothetical protein
MPANVWTFLDASSWDDAGVEPQGQQAHLWLRTDEEPRTWLFKKSDATLMRPLPEHLTEKIASELATLIGVPAARVSLAERNGTVGCLVEDLRWTKGQDQPGQVLLGGIVQDYDPKDSEHRGHNVANIHEALAGYEAPPASPTPTGFTAFDVFAGYLVFDAVIANGDRHDRNWAILIRPPGAPGASALCGSYDHASSLGFNVSDRERSERLANDTVQQWAKRGAARQFEKRSGQPRQSLVELARSALALCRAEVRDYWLDAVSSLQRGSVQLLLDSAPGLSETTRRFTTEVIMINRGRVLNDD